MITERILRAIYSEPLLITPQAHSSIRALFESKMATGDFMRTGEDSCGSMVDMPGMTIANGVAQIPVAGAIGQGLNGFAKGQGAVDVADIEEEINAAESDPLVRVIAFIYDSPGGMVSGTPELAQRIKAIQKPNYAFAAGQMCSAAYWTAAASNAIYVTATSDVGSIGVYMAVFDQTKALAMEGISVDLIKAGKFKGMGFPGTSLNKAQREHLQTQIDSIAGMFKSHVRSRRGAIADDTMQGQTFMGRDAMAAGLADHMVSGKAEFLNHITPR